MHLRKVQIKGFQSFEDSKVINFSSGINLIVGENNSGKSALLRALRVSIQDDRHRSEGKFEEYELTPPIVELEIEISGIELRRALMRSPGQVYVPIIAAGSEGQRLAFESMLALTELVFALRNSPGGPSSPNVPSWQVADPGQYQHSAAVNSAPGNIAVIDGNYALNDSLWPVVWGSWSAQAFHFNAERFSIDRCTISNTLALGPSAANLPAVLFTLSGDQGSKFDELVKHLREIFPSIGNLSVRPVPGTQDVEIRVWPTQEMNNVQLGFPLSQCGTGVGQVIAILSAVITSDHAVIAIDEINSFLHPAAVKSLLRVIQTYYASHQYIVSTHSPEVISFANPSTLHLVTRNGYKSSVTALDPKDVQSFREIAGQLGITMSDVFAAERIVWVEGQTEELCFPFLYEATVGAIPRGVKISSVIATGDFNAKGRDAKLIFDIYDRISSAAAPLTKSVTFSFDSESLSPAEKEDMGKRSRGKVKFLPRRHLECFLIDPSAIASLVGEKDSHPAPSPGDVENELCKIAVTGKFDGLKIWKGDLTDENWLSTVDAANLIKDVCAALSDHRVSFSKGHDSLLLLQYLVRHEPKKVAPLVRYVKALIEKS